MRAFLLTHKETAAFPGLPRGGSIPPDADILVRYQAPWGSDQALWTLNGRRGLSNWADKERSRKLLTLNKVRVAPPEIASSLHVRWGKVFHIYVFDLRVVAMTCTAWPARGDKLGEICVSGENSPLPEGSKESQTACLMAIRAVYALGLDFAKVEVIFPHGLKPIVLAIDPAPDMDGKLGEQFMTALSEYAKRLSVDWAKNHVLLGADPEFMLYDNLQGSLILASTFFPQEGRVGCDARSIGGKKKDFPLAELRPDPAPTPEMLLAHVRQAMVEALKLAPFKNVEWRGGSQPFVGYPIGGHIHFSGVPLTTPVLRALDNYLAVPLMLIEHPRTARLRRRRYGILGDFRVKEYGGFEYRTPASWLVSPEVAKGVFALAALIVREFPRLKTNLLETVEGQTAFYRCDKMYFYSRFPALWRELSATPAFPAYKKDILPLMELIWQRRIWNEKADLRKTWQLKIPTGVYFQEETRQGVVGR